MVGEKGHRELGTSCGEIDSAAKIQEMSYLIAQYVGQTKRGIQLCLSDALVVPALALLYSGIDVLGYLGSSQASATRRTFIDWSDQYLASFLGVKGISGTDLYSARCGVLHTGQAPSDMVNSGKARELWYRFRGESHINLLTSTPQPAVLIDIEELSQAFEAAMDAFSADLGSNATLAAQAGAKAEVFFRPGLLLQH